MHQELRQEIARNKHADEHSFIAKMIETPALPPAQREATLKLARDLVAECRADTDNQSLLDSFLLEFGLSNKEGVALMCLAEALLRVPDDVNIDRLIAEKIKSGDWRTHSGKSNSPFVNAATWGMILTGKMVQLDSKITENPGSWMRELTSNLSEPIVRAAVMQAMKIMGGQYVLGRSIKEGFKRAGKFKKANANARIRYSFDMLGEAARTEQDALRYYDAYKDALEQIGQHSASHRTSDSVADADGISVKLSALHPRYEKAQEARVRDELYPRIKALCVMAKHHNIGLSIDAEEAARLELSLDLFERLCTDPDLQEWEGLGFVLQAYQKRAPSVARWLLAVSKSNQRKIMVRLVKGAYWDAEIKHAQEQGLSDYPVFTVKAHTDACYMACAKILLSAKDCVYAQFATHNAQTVAALIQLSQLVEKSDYEFQRLHGMGDLLYHHLRLNPEFASQAIRIYAPIGKHEDLLPYLVRRLLENGANSSFVNRFLDDRTPLNELVKDVIDDIQSQETYRHPRIPLPKALFEQEITPRINSRGWDIDEAHDLLPLLDAIEDTRAKPLHAKTLVGGVAQCAEQHPIDNPNDHRDQVGQVDFADKEIIEAALATAHGFKQSWQAVEAPSRADILVQWSDLLEAHTPELVAIISREAGRTLADCIDEVREAVDFCRYYANQATSAQYQDAVPLGTVFCVSPWNFPLAIFIGQISAALAAGNCVIAKPAEQTPTIATRAIELLLEAGCPSSAIHLMQGYGADVGKVLLSDERINGVAFTGSTQTAQIIHRSVANRADCGIALLAETGGQNCMIVDSTALPEQVVDDVIRSAFHSAGQRCSALRVLYVQEDIADKLVNMLKTASDSVYVGDSRYFSSDVGPIIDDAALQRLHSHIERMQSIGAKIHRIPLSDALRTQGNFFAPAIIEIDSISALTHEVFGPIVHIIRYPANQLSKVIEQINSTGFGLTLGVHSRIETIADYVFRKTNAGNTYINRNVIGAVVGVNPFGGSGLSGTGPKAGGPHYLSRFFSALGRYESVPAIDIRTANKVVAEFSKTQSLPGPTGEENLLSIRAAGRIGLLGFDNDQTQIALATYACLFGNELVCIGATTETVHHLHDALRSIGIDENKIKISEVSLNDASAAKLAVVLANSAHPERVHLQRLLAASEGAIVQTIAYNSSGLHPNNLVSLLPHLFHERTKTDNLIARGGNTQLFNL